MLADAAQATGRSVVHHAAMPPEWFIVVSVLIALYLLWRIGDRCRSIAWNLKCFTEIVLAAEKRARREQRR